MTTNKKIETVLVEFDFAADVTQQVYDKVKNRVQRYIDGTGYEASASFFLSRQSISVAITYDLTNADSRKIHDELSTRLNTLINWHKEAATYQWNNSAISQKEGN